MVTLFTPPQEVDNQRLESLRAALINLCVQLRPLDGPPAVIRTDPPPGFRAIVDDEFLHKQRLAIEIGRVKNINKNPVAEKAVQKVVHLKPAAWGPCVTCPAFYCNLSLEHSYS